MKKEGEIQAEICKWLRSQSAFFWRVNTTPTYDRKLNSGYGGYRGMGAYAMKGAPDVVCIDRYGGFIGIEVKKKGGKMSPDQVLFKKRCKSHNAQYHCVTSLAELKELELDIKL